jgi:hypothetical protein
LLRNETLDEDTQVRFAETFGPPAKITSGRTFSVKHPSCDTDLEHPRGRQT